MLSFGLPGTGKTHALCAVGHWLVESGRSVLFAPACRLVQDFLAAKPDLALPRELLRLDNYDFLLLEALGYLPQGAEESEVLFSLIAERHERRSLGITSNLVFSQWDHIFANPMGTAAAVDLVVHYSGGLEAGRRDPCPTVRRFRVRLALDSGGIDRKAAEQLERPSTDRLMTAVGVPAVVVEGADVHRMF